MMRSLAVVLILMVATAVPGRTEAGSPTSAFEGDADPTAQGRIDELVLGRLKQLGITPARVCSDGVFVRRAYLDVIGTLPTADEARQFLQDSDPDKRRKLIDRLLERDEFADYWAMKWCDLLRVKSEFPIKLWPNAVQAYHRWIRTSIKENMPYDRFVREMLTASGSNFRDPQVNFYRAVQSREPQAIAQAVALSVHGRAAGELAQRALVGHGGLLLADRLQAHRRMEGRDRPVRSREGPQPAGHGIAPGGRLSRRGAGPARAGRGSAQGVCRLAGQPQESLVHSERRQPRLVLAVGPGHHPSGGRYPSGQPARQSRAVGLPRAGPDRGSIRPEASLPTDPQLDDVSVVVHRPGATIPGRRRISRTIRSAAWRPRC